MEIKTSEQLETAIELYMQKYGKTPKNNLFMDIKNAVGANAELSKYLNKKMFETRYKDDFTNDYLIQFFPPQEQVRIISDWANHATRLGKTRAETQEVSDNYGIHNIMKYVSPDIAKQAFAKGDELSAVLIMNTIDKEIEKTKTGNLTHFVDRFKERNGLKKLKRIGNSALTDMQKNVASSEKEDSAQTKI